MSLVGADLEGMDRLKVDFERGASEIERLTMAATQGAQQLRGLWDGNDAQEFTHIWDQRHRPAMHRAAAALGEAASMVELNRAAQQDASAVDGVGGSGGPTGTLGGGGGGDHASGKKIDDDIRIAGWEEVEGDLFVDGGSEGGIHANDIDQRDLGDCYYVAALAGMADHDPQLIRDAITDNGDGTYTVTLWEKVDGEYQAVEVTVNNEMPVTETWDDENGKWVSSNHTAGEGDGELWPRIFEKAYAHHLGDGDLIAGYSEIIGGDGANALEALTGVESQTYGSDHFSIEELETMHSEGVLLPASHRERQDAGWWDKLWGDPKGFYPAGSDEVHTSHQYWVDSVDAEAGTVTVRNPWAYADGDRYLIELSYDEFTDAFREIDYNALEAAD